MVGRGCFGLVSILVWIFCVRVFIIEFEEIVMIILLVLSFLESEVVFDIIWFVVLVMFC